MKQIIDRLRDDLRWRLGAAGKKYRPSKAELNSWGVARFPCVVPLLASSALCISAAALVSAVVGGSAERDILAALLGLPLIPVLFWAGYAICGTVQRGLDLRAYTRLITRHERFMLVEYQRYLRRRSAMAMADRRYGTPADITRLRELEKRIGELLREQDRRSGLSHLSEEAVLAESVLESFSTAQRDELSLLDDRLPESMRSRLAELEQEYSRGSAPVASEHTGPRSSDLPQSDLEGAAPQAEADAKTRN